MVSSCCKNLWVPQPGCSGVFKDPSVHFKEACASSFEAAEAMQEAEDVASVFQAGKGGEVRCLRQ